MSEPERDRAIVSDRIAVAAGAALLAAGLIFVMFVLPAEFAVDPFGVGKRLGLLELGLTGRQIDKLTATRGGGKTAVITPQEQPFKEDATDFTVAPHQFVEYKYRLKDGQALLYSWHASEPVNYELHAEPDGAPRGYAESYEKKTHTGRASGTLTAPFDGIHGWYWENTGDRDVTISLKTAGFYTMSHEFRKDVPVKNKMFD